MTTEKTNQCEPLIKGYFTIEIEEDENETKNEDMLVRFKSSITKIEIYYSSEEINIEFTEFEIATQIDYILYFKNKHINIIINFFKPNMETSPIKSYKISYCKPNDKNKFIADLSNCDIRNNIFFNFSRITEIEIPSNY